MICTKKSTKISKRDVRIEVSEDGENGCEIPIPKKRQHKTDYKTYGEQKDRIILTH